MGKKESQCCCRRPDLTDQFRYGGIICGHCGGICFTIEDQEPPLPEFSTNVLPGPGKKVRLLVERAARGEALFHPEDYTGKEDNRT